MKRTPYRIYALLITLYSVPFQAWGADPYAQKLNKPPVVQLAGTGLQEELAEQWKLFKQKHLDPKTSKWSEEMEKASRITKETLEKAQHGSDSIVRILNTSKDFPTALKNPRHSLQGANVQISIRRAYLQSLVQNMMAKPIPLDEDITNSYFQLSNLKISFDQKNNIVTSSFTDGFAGFKNLIKAGIKVHKATMQFAPKIVKKGNRFKLLLTARLTFIDVANHSPVVDKLFAALVEELVLSKGPVIEVDLTRRLMFNRSLDLFGQKKSLRIVPDQIGVNVSNKHLLISAKL